MKRKIEKEKEFDAVAIMREIRDRLNDQIAGMTFEEEERFLREHVPERKPRLSRKPSRKTLQPVPRKMRRG